MKLTLEELGTNLDAVELLLGGPHRMVGRKLMDELRDGANLYREYFDAFLEVEAQVSDVVEHLAINIVLCWTAWVLEKFHRPLCKGLLGRAHGIVYIVTKENS